MKGISAEDVDKKKCDSSFKAISRESRAKALRTEEYSQEIGKYSINYSSQEFIPTVKFKNPNH